MCKTSLSDGANVTSDGISFYGKVLKRLWRFKSADITTDLWKNEMNTRGCKSNKNRERRQEDIQDRGFIR